MAPTTAPAPAPTATGLGRHSRPATHAGAVAIAELMRIRCHRAGIWLGRWTRRATTSDAPRTRAPVPAPATRRAIPRSDRSARPAMAPIPAAKATPSPRLGAPARVVPASATAPATGSVCAVGRSPTIPVLPPFGVAGGPGRPDPGGSRDATVQTRRRLCRRRPPQPVAVDNALRLWSAGADGPGSPWRWTTFHSPPSRRKTVVKRRV